MPKLRAGSEAASILLTSDSLEEWTEAYNSYDRSVERLSEEKNRAGLVEMDRWWRMDLPASLRSRGAEPYLTKEELVNVVKWKMWMGVVRPNLLRFANETDPGKVKTKSREAFRHLPRPPPRSPSPSEVAHENTAVETAGAGDTERVTSAATKKAVTALTSELKGVGPATASAILAALSGGCPFDADEVIDAVMKTGVRKYSLPEYLEVQEALAEKAERLGNPWDAERVRKAIWSKAMHARFNLEEPAEQCETRQGAEGSEEPRRRKSAGGGGSVSKRQKSRR